MAAEFVLAPQTMAPGSTLSNLAFTSSAEQGRRKYHSRAGVKASPSRELPPGLLATQRANTPCTGGRKMLVCGPLYSRTTHSLAPLQLDVSRMDLAVFLALFRGSSSIWRRAFNLRLACLRVFLYPCLASLTLASHSI